MKESLFAELRESMNEVIEHAQGKRNLKTTIIHAPQPISSKKIIRIREQINCSQGVFAALLNVSVRTVQAWEQGKRKPSDAALKLLSIAEKNPQVLF